MNIKQLIHIHASWNAHRHEDDFRLKLVLYTCRWRCRYGRVVRNGTGRGRFGGSRSRHAYPCSVSATH